MLKDIKLSPFMFKNNINLPTRNNQICRTFFIQQERLLIRTKPTQRVYYVVPEG